MMGCENCARLAKALSESIERSDERAELASAYEEYVEHLQEHEEEPRGDAEWNKPITGVLPPKQAG
jgi:hypothetical protein